MPLQYPYTPEESPVNWWTIILVFAGILIVIVFVTVFFIIPDYVRGYLNNKTLERISNLSDNIVAYGCSSDLYNCGNFTTQAHAQDVFDWCVGQGQGDIHQLDKDGNGKACESLP